MVNVRRERADASGVLREGESGRDGGAVSLYVVVDGIVVVGDFQRGHLVVRREYPVGDLKKFSFGERQCHGTPPVVSCCFSKMSCHHKFPLQKSKYG